MVCRERGRSLNILHSLRARELGGDPLATGATTSNPLGAHRAATRQLGVWAEASFLKHASGSYAELQVCPKSLGPSGWPLPLLGDKQETICLASSGYIHACILLSAAFAFCPTALPSVYHCCGL
jgi:hypothetical protein